MSDQVEKNPVYVALADIGCSLGVIKQGRKIPGNIVDQLGGYEEAKKAGSLCLESEYNKIVTDLKNKDNEALKKGEDARKDLIKKREAKKQAAIKKAADDKKATEKK